MSIDSQVQFEPIQPEQWSFEPGVAFLNHGSFGACPKPVLQAQARWRSRMERQPVLFLARELEPLMDDARHQVAAALGALPENMVFLANATAGANTVLQHIPLEVGDEVIVSDHGYNAVNNAVRVAAEARGATVRTVALPFPLSDPKEWISAWLGAVGPRSRLAVVDYITSPTAVLSPVHELVPALENAGVAVLVDGAHAPGMVPLQLESLGASFFTGNLHKWLFAPKGCAVLWVAPRWQKCIRPLITSHGHNSTRTDRSRFLLEHDWLGTCDPSAWLSAPEAIQFAERLLPGGLPSLMERNHGLALAAAQELRNTLGGNISAPDGAIGSMVTLPLGSVDPGPAHAKHGVTPLQLWLWNQHSIEVVVLWWSGQDQGPLRPWIRISAQAYNGLLQYRRLAQALAAWQPAGKFDGY